MAEYGQTAYEARIADRKAADVPPWADLPEDARGVWRRVERAVLAAANRLQVIAEAWEADLTLPQGPDLYLADAQARQRDENLDGSPRRRGVPVDTAPTLTQAESARDSGSSDNACASCGSFAMIRTGTCETCQACGSTSGGCS